MLVKKEHLAQAILNIPVCRNPEFSSHWYLTLRVVLLVQGFTHRQGPCTVYFRNLVKQAIPGIGFGTRFLKWAICGPFGSHYMNGFLGA